MLDLNPVHRALSKDLISADQAAEIVRDGMLADKEGRAFDTRAQLTARGLITPVQAAELVGDGTFARGRFPKAAIVAFVVFDLALVAAALVFVLTTSNPTPDANVDVSGLREAAEHERALVTHVATLMSSFREAQPRLQALSDDRANLMDDNGRPTADAWRLFEQFERAHDTLLELASIKRATTSTAVLAVVADSDLEHSRRMTAVAAAGIALSMDEFGLARSWLARAAEAGAPAELLEPMRQQLED